MPTMIKIWRDNRPHYISMSNTDKRTRYKETWQCALHYTLPNAWQ